MNIVSKEKLNQKCWFCSNGTIYFDLNDISDMVYACYDITEYPSYRKALEDLEIEFEEAKNFEEMKECLKDWKQSRQNFLASLPQNIFAN